MFRTNLSIMIARMTLSSPSPCQPAQHTVSSHHRIALGPDPHPQNIPRHDVSSVEHARIPRKPPCFTLASRTKVIASLAIPHPPRRGAMPRAVPSLTPSLPSRTAEILSIVPPIHWPAHDEQLDRPVRQSHSCCHRHSLPSPADSPEGGAAVPGLIAVKC